MFTTVWEYDVPPEHRDVFVAVYGANGRWAAFFRGAAGWRETILFEDVDRAGRFVTLDRWESREASEVFLASERAAYDALDAETAGLARAEHHLGTFET